MITAKEFLQFAPRAKQQYTSVITSTAGHKWLDYSGITDSEERLFGFLGISGHETGGFTIIRESLRYKTTARLREVWPKLLGPKTDRELSRYVNNELELAGAVYRNRMGNITKEDAYYFRGGAWLQSTGKSAYLKYGAKIGVDFQSNPNATNDMGIMLAIACLEWMESGCNDLIDAGDFVGACAMINVGSASTTAKRSIIGLEDRKLWRNRARKVWQGDKDWASNPPIAITQRVDDPETAPLFGVNWTEVAGHEDTAKEIKEWYS